MTRGEIEGGFDTEHNPDVCELRNPVFVNCFLFWKRFVWFELNN